MQEYLGTVKLFGFDFAPTGWAKCDGSLMVIADNAALLNLIGIRYGGDGVTTFALPNLTGRMAISAGQSPNSSVFMLGQMGGEENTTLQPNQIPAHRHPMTASALEPNQNTAQNAALASGSRNVAMENIYGTGDFVNNEVIMASKTSIQEGVSGQAHNNMPPFLALNYCICIEGDYPPRS